MKNIEQLEWLLFFYTIPAMPVNNRMKIWRKLVKSGAIQLKGGVYILPHSEEHHEALQWLLAELPGLNGEGLLLKTASIEPLRQQQIIALFDEQRRQEYREVRESIDEFVGRLRNLRKGGADSKPAPLSKEYKKIQNDFATVQRRDFFHSEFGAKVAEQIEAVRAQLDELAKTKTGKQRSGSIDLQKGLSLNDFTGMTWITRKRPFVDRMASAWLIRRFIDAKAVFVFQEEADLTASKAGAGKVTFDVRDGDFTHIDDLCTFEVLIDAFGLKAKGKGLEHLAGIVHDLDVKDGKYCHPEAPGVEMILKGIRSLNATDHKTLEEGIAVFEALYRSIAEQYQ